MDLVAVMEFETTNFNSEGVSLTSHEISTPETTRNTIL